MPPASTEAGPANRPPLPTVISLLACGGSLPRQAAEIIRHKGCRLNVVAIRGMADADYDGFSVTTVGIGEIGALLKALKAGGARDMLIAGHVQRPDLARLRIDLGFVFNIATIASLQRGGDDHVMRRIAGFFERNGLTVRSIAEIVPELLTPAGVLTGKIPPPALADARRGFDVVHQLGEFDMGQAVVMSNRHLIAVEGAEGTNGLISRTAEILRTRHQATADAPDNDESRRQTVLVKVSKPGQDLRVDLPTIGRQTVEYCKKAGIGYIAIETARSLIVEREETLAAADAAGIAIIGLNCVDWREEPAVDTNWPLPPDLPNASCAVLAGPRPTSKFMRDMAKGRALLRTLTRIAKPQAATLARENILSVAIGEKLAGYIGRTRSYAQWADRRQPLKRNRVLILASPEELDQDALEAISSDPKIGVIAFARPVDNGAVSSKITDLAIHQKVSVVVWQ